MTTTKVEPADQVHFVASGLTLITESERIMPVEVTAYRGLTVTITSRLLEANSNKYGECWLHLDADEQLARWGKVHFLRGPAPAGMLPWIPGSIEEDIARDRARARAETLPLDEKLEALAEVRRVFGSKSTSRTFREYS